MRQLQGEATRLQTQISAFGRVQSSFSTLRDAAAKLILPGTWSASTATSTDTTKLGATATGGLKGNYSVVVSRLASTQTLSSAAVASPSTSMGSGTLRIELGDFDSVPPVPKSGASAIDLNIDPATSSMSQIRDQINGAGAGVVASIVNDVSGSRLVLRSAETGAASSTCCRSSAV